MEGIDGDDEDRMSATTDSLNTSNDDDDKNSNTSFNEKRNDANDSNHTENNKFLLKNKNNINDNDNSNNDNSNNNNSNNNNSNNNNNNNNDNNNSNNNKIQNEKLITIEEQKVFPSNTTQSASSDMTDKTYHESEKYSIILDAGSELFEVNKNVVLDDTKICFVDDRNIFFENSNMIGVEKMKDEKCTSTADDDNNNNNNNNNNNDNNNSIDNNNDEIIARTESNPRDELIMTFATAILKSGTKSVDSQYEIRSNNDLNLNLSSSSDSSRRNSQVHSASGVCYVLCAMR